MANVFRTDGDQIINFYGISLANRWDFKTHQPDGGNNYQFFYHELSRSQLRFNNFFSKRNSTIHLMQLPVCPLMNSVTVSKCAKRFPVLPNQKFITIYRPNGSNIGKKTAEVSAFVNAKTKMYYDSCHMPLLLNAIFF